jgi:fucose 4-O-acetylase-like acetyltransferase
MTVRELFSLSVQSTNRLAWMDYAKGIAIIMVVLRHITIGMELGGIPIDPVVFEVVDNVGLTLRMPLFFLLSGIFFRKSILKRTQIGYVLHKTKTIIYPYLIWAFISTSLQLILSGFVNTKTSWWSYLDIFIAPTGHWWFLVALFNISILYLVMYILTKGNHVLLLLAGLLMFYVAPHVEYFSIHYHILRLFIFFVAGDIIAKTILDKKNLKYLTSGWLLAICGLCTIAGEWILFQEEWREITTLHLLFPLVGSSAIILVANQLATFRSRIFSFIRTVGQHSLYVYLLHALVGAAVRMVFVYGFGISNYWVILPVSVLAAVVLPIYIYRLCKNYGFWFLFTPEPPVTITAKTTADTRADEKESDVDPVNASINTQIVNS